SDPTESASSPTRRSARAAEHRGVARGLDPSPIALYARAIGISRLTRVLVCASVVALVLAPAAHARAGSLRTLTIRAPVPAAGDLTVVAFEMSAIGEGKQHRSQAARFV